MADVCLLLLEDGSGYLELEDGSGRLELEACLQPAAPLSGGWVEEWRVRENEADIVAATLALVMSRRRRLRVG